MNLCQKILTSVRATSPSRGFSRNVENLYNILRVPQNCSNQEIKASYIRMAKKFHPDTSGNSNSKEKFSQISEAYRTLSNPELRRLYDSKLSRICHKNFYHEYGFNYQRSVHRHKEQQGSTNSILHRKRDERTRNNPGISFNVALGIQTVGIIIAGFFGNAFRKEHS